MRALLLFPSQTALPGYPAPITHPLAVCSIVPRCIDTRCKPAAFQLHFCSNCSVSAHLSNILATVLPILLSLLIRYLTGKRLPKPVVTPLVGAITPVVWVILFIIGMGAGAAFSTLASGMQVLPQPAIYAFTLSALVFACLLPLPRSGR